MLVTLVMRWIAFYGNGDFMLSCRFVESCCKYQSGIFAEYPYICSRKIPFLLTASTIVLSVRYLSGHHVPFSFVLEHSSRHYASRHIVIPDTFDNSQFGTHGICFDYTSSLGVPFAESGIYGFLLRKHSSMVLPLNRMPLASFLKYQYSRLA